MKIPGTLSYLVHREQRENVLENLRYYIKLALLSQMEDTEHF